jgi:hypothetical protein
MKLYVALTKLRRGEWAKGTVWAVAKGLFEIGLRKCLRDDGDDTVAAHVSLFFEGSTERMRQLNASVVPASKQYGSFCVDVLENDSHTVSSFQDRSSWYRRWEWARVELYEVVGVTDSEIERAHNAILSYLQASEPYDCSRNVNALFPWFPCACKVSCFFCCCCPFFVWSGGVTCVSACLVGLAAARGVTNPTTSSKNDIYEALGLSNRVILGARLPAEAVEELIDNNQINHTPVVHLFQNTKAQQHGAIPLLAVT